MIINQIIQCLNIMLQLMKCWILLGLCSFRMYMKRKPNKYGLKIMYLWKKKFYLYNAFVYCGKSNVPNPKKIAIPTLNVLETCIAYF